MSTYSRLHRRFMLIVASLGVLISGCGMDIDQYRQIHESARTALPIAVQMEELFGPADHFITHYGIRSEKTNTWSTVVYVGNRYELVMKVEVSVDYEKRVIHPVGEPQFSMIEIEGGDGFTRVGKNFRFSKEESDTLRENKGNFASIGISVNPDPVARFSEYVDGYRKDRIPISLLK